MLTLVFAVAVRGQDDSAAFVPMGSGYTPQGLTTTVEYDPQTNSYVRVRKAGNVVLGREYMSFDDYQDWQMDQLLDQYWKEKSEGTVLDNAEGGLLSKIPGFSQISDKLDVLNKIPEIKINPSGSVELTFQLVHTFRDNPQYAPRLDTDTFFRSTKSVSAITSPSTSTRTYKSTSTPR